MEGLHRLRREGQSENAHANIRSPTSSQNANAFDLSRARVRNGCLAKDRYYERLVIIEYGPGVPNGGLQGPSRA